MLRDTRPEFVCIYHKREAHNTRFIRLLSAIKASIRCLLSAVFGSTLEKDYHGHFTSR